MVHGTFFFFSLFHSQTYNKKKEILNVNGEKVLEQCKFVDLTKIVTPIQYIVFIFILSHLKVLTSNLETVYFLLEAEEKGNLSRQNNALIANTVIDSGCSLFFNFCHSGFVTSIKALEKEGFINYWSYTMKLID